jgi:hypothetical protein
VHNEQKNQRRTPTPPKRRGVLRVRARVACAHGLQRTRNAKTTTKEGRSGRDTRHPAPGSFHRYSLRFRVSAVVVGRAGGSGPCSDASRGPVFNPKSVAVAGQTVTFAFPASKTKFRLTTHLLQPKRVWLSVVSSRDPRCLARPLWRDKRPVCGAAQTSHSQSAR